MGIQLFRKLSTKLCGGDIAVIPAKSADTDFSTAPITTTIFIFTYHIIYIISSEHITEDASGGD
jgi:hypothetical protein